MWQAAHEMKFLATPVKGEVSALLVRPENAMRLLVLGYGANTSMRHATLQAIAERLAEMGIATLRDTAHGNRTRRFATLTPLSPTRSDTG